jgi:hypothetical protein
MTDTKTLLLEVKTVFSAEIGDLRREMEKLKRQANEAKNPLKGLQDQIKSLSNIVLGATAAIGGLATYGMARLVKSMVQVAAKTETATFGMAVMLQSADRLRGRMTPFAAAMSEAAETMELLRRAARDTPGTLDQVREAYQAILGPGRTAGMSNAELVKIAAQIATQDALSGSPGLVIRDVSQALRGRSDADSGVLQMSGVVPKAAELARRGKHGEALRMLAGALRVDDEALRAAGATFEGRMATFQDQIDALKRAVGGPIFAAVNEELAKASEWLENNKAKVDAWAKAVGGSLLTALRAVKDILVWMIENREAIIKWAVMLVGASLLVKAVGLAKEVVVTFQGLGKVLSILASHPFFTVVASTLGALAIVTDQLVYPAEERAKHEAEIERGKRISAGFKAAKPLEKELDAYLSSPQAVLDAAADNLALARAKVKAIEAALGPEALAELRKQDVTPWWFIAVNDLENKAMRPEEVARARRLVEEEAKARKLAEKEARRKNAILPAGAPSLNGGINIDARHSRITVNTRVETDNPAAFADVSLKSAFVAVAAAPLSATFGLGAPRLATGAP